MKTATTTHSVPEDALALVAGALFVSLGLLLFKHQGFLTGGTAGLALVLTKVLPFSFGQVFFVINLPFYWLAYSRMGGRFTLNTFVSVAAVSLLADNLSLVIELGRVNAIFAAIMGGFLIGTGMLVFFRHRSSLGGVGILALYVQERFGLSAGRLQMGVDVAIVCVGFFLVPLPVLALSILGALALNVVIALNHKPGRYQIT
ncbi:YitT family protein [Saccharospirillum mangrovi]|uniref:YitT family protein n=1 Tax=Saccharospirillum mangrovi TaxID=2161747 RepID=UPI000D3CE943|nr:YitT family protein [Saccharospirillum mangrovi]